MINTMSDLRNLREDCCFLAEQAAALEIMELAKQRSGVAAWKPAIAIPAAKKRQRRIERLMNRLGIPWDMSVEYGNGRTEYYRLKQGEVKPVD